MIEDNDTTTINVLKTIEDNAPHKLAEIDKDMNSIVLKLVDLSKDYTHYLVLNKIIEALK